MMYSPTQPPFSLPLKPFRPGFVSGSRPTTPGTRVNVEPSTVINSRRVYPKVDGAISVEAGLEYEINGSGTWATAPGVLTASDYYRVRLTSSANYSTEVALDVTVDGTAYTFSVTTMAEDLGIAERYLNTDHYTNTEHYL